MKGKNESTHPPFINLINPFINFINLIDPHQP